MRKMLFAIVAVAVMTAIATPDAAAQRRQRPGSMKHTQAEVTEAQKVTKGSARYVKADSEWSGPFYMTNGDAGLELGKAVLLLGKGTYTFTVKFGSDKIREVHRDTARPYTTRAQFGQDFTQKGSYQLLSQYGKTLLRLMDGEKVFTDIPITDGTGEKLEFTADEFLFRLDLNYCEEWRSQETDMRMRQQSTKDQRMKQNAKKSK